MKLDELLVKLDEEQQLTLCIGINGEWRITGDQASIIRMMSDDIKDYEVDYISTRTDKTIWVWLREGK